MTTVGLLLIVVAVILYAVSAASGSVGGRADTGAAAASRERQQGNFAHVIAVAVHSLGLATWFYAAGRLPYTGLDAIALSGWCAGLLGLWHAWTGESRSSRLALLGLAASAGAVSAGLDPQVATGSHSGLAFAWCLAHALALAASFGLVVIAAHRTWRNDTGSIAGVSTVIVLAAGAWALLASVPSAFQSAPFSVFDADGHPVLVEVLLRLRDQAASYRLLEPAHVAVPSFEWVRGLTVWALLGAAVTVLIATGAPRRAFRMAGAVGTAVAGVALLALFAVVAYCAVGVAGVQVDVDLLQRAWSAERLGLGQPAAVLSSVRLESAGTGLLTARSFPATWALLCVLLPFLGMATAFRLRALFGAPIRASRREDASIERTERWLALVATASWAVLLLGSLAWLMQLRGAVWSDDPALYVRASALGGLGTWWAARAHFGHRSGFALAALALLTVAAFFVVLGPLLGWSRSSALPF